MVDYVLKQKSKDVRFMYSLLALCVFETLSSMSHAADLVHGQSIIKSICSSCHMGNSSSDANMPLQAATADGINEALNSVSAMLATVKPKLQAADIQDVAAFVAYEVSNGRPQSSGTINVDLVTPPSQPTIAPQPNVTAQPIVVPVQSADTQPIINTNLPTQTPIVDTKLDADASQKLQPLVAALKQAEAEYKQDLSNGASSTVLMNDRGALKQALEQLRQAMAPYNTRIQKGHKKHRRNQSSKGLCLNGVPQNNLENSNGTTPSDLLNINNSPTNITIINNIIYNNTNGNSSSGNSNNPFSNHKHSKNGGSGGSGGDDSGKGSGSSSDDDGSSGGSCSKDGSGGSHKSGGSSSDDGSSGSNKGKKGSAGSTDEEDNSDAGSTGTGSKGQTSAGSVSKGSSSGTTGSNGDATTGSSNNGNSNGSTATSKDATAGTTTLPSNGTWNKANLTNFTSFPAAGSDECVNYNGCQWAGQFAFVDGAQTLSWVQANNIIAVHSKDATKYKLKTLRLKQGNNQIDAKVYDMCSDSDCNGCCTQNASQNGLNFLIDIEQNTMKRFGVGEGVVEWQCLDC